MPTVPLSTLALHPTHLTPVLPQPIPPPLPTPSPDLNTLILLLFHTLGFFNKAAASPHTRPFLHLSSNRQHLFSFFLPHQTHCLQQHHLTMSTSSTVSPPTPLPKRTTNTNTNNNFCSITDHPHQMQSLHNTI